MLGKVPDSGTWCLTWAALRRSCLNECNALRIIVVSVALPFLVGFHGVGTDCMLWRFFCKPAAD